MGYYQANWTLIHGDQTYVRGDEFALEDALAQEYVDMGVLESIPEPPLEPEPEPEPVDLSGLTKAELVAYAAKMGLELDPGQLTKAEMIAAIEAAEEAS